MESEKKLLNRKTEVNGVPNVDVTTRKIFVLAQYYHLPKLAEIIKAFKELKNGESPDVDNNEYEILKTIQKQQQILVMMCWNKHWINRYSHIGRLEERLGKRTVNSKRMKGGRTLCNNSKGIVFFFETKQNYMEQNHN